jgi:tRNA G46 methylase TrmB
MCHRGLEGNFQYTLGTSGKGWVFIWSRTIIITQYQILKKLKNEDWQNPYSTNDVEMNEAAQISLVEEFERFEPEFKKLDEVGPGHHVDGAVYYSMVRELEPETIIEVGAGRSTNVALQASQENENEPEIIAVEPHPSDYLQSLSKSTAVLEFVNRKQSIFSQSGILRN